MSGDYFIDNGLPKLSEYDRSALEIGSGIDSAVIAERGYYTAQAPLQLEKLGFTAAQARIPALVMPLFSPSGQTSYQVRPHATPEYNGKPHKYLIAKGDHLVLDVHPRNHVQLKDSTVPKWVTEGTKKADAGTSHGLCCISLAGVYSWRDPGGPLPDWEDVPVRGHTFILAFDSDLTTNPNVYDALNRLKRWLERKGARVRTCYLPAGKGGNKTGLDDYLLVRSVAELDAIVVDDLQRPTLPGIQVNNRQLREVRDDALRALLDRNIPPKIYMRSGKLTRLIWQDGSMPTLEQFTPDALRNPLSDAVNFYSVGGQATTAVLPPNDIVRAMLAMDDYRDFPVIDSIATAPIFAADGTLLMEQGYNAAARAFLHAPELQSLPTIETSPEAVIRARTLLTELVCDFQFVDDASLAHAFAFMLQPFLRNMIAGGTPLFIFDAPKSSSGKSLLANTLASIFHGGPLIDRCINN